MERTCGQHRLRLRLDERKGWLPRTAHRHRRQSSVGKKVQQAVQVEIRGGTTSGDSHDSSGGSGEKANTTTLGQLGHVAPCDDYVVGRLELPKQKPLLVSSHSITATPQCGSNASKAGGQPGTAGPW